MVDLFKALAEENRLRILSLLLQQDLCVCELEHCLELKQSNISRHLSVLKRSGLVESYKDQQWAYYKISRSLTDEHEQLRSYLDEKLKKLPTFQDDMARIETYREHEVCRH